MQYLTSTANNYQELSNLWSDEHTHGYKKFGIVTQALADLVPIASELINLWQREVLKLIFLKAEPTSSFWKSVLAMKRRKLEGLKINLNSEH